jgi:parallel beta-helix repeat protein
MQFSTLIPISRRAGRRPFLQAAAILMFMAALNASAKDITLYVAPDGDDTWSGTIAASTEDQRNGPKATLQGALKAVRQWRATPDGAQGTAQILLRGGFYPLEETVVLTPEDSGLSAKQPLRIAAFQNESPVLSAGQHITGWQPVPGQPGLWSVEIPAVRHGAWYFHELFVNGQRQIRARTPNADFFRIQGASPQDHPIQIHYKPGDIKKEWADDGDVEVVAYLAWGDVRMQIRKVDETNHVATLSGDPRESNKENDAKYYIENAPDALDMPGEWYLNRRTGVLTYWASPGQDMKKAEVISPTPITLFRLKGDANGQRPVHDVVFDGLTFSHTDWTLPESGYADTQAAFAIQGDFCAENAVDCRITRCQFKHLAGYAIELGPGCQRCTVDSNEISDIGAGGIRVGEPAEPGEAWQENNHNIITDNHIHHLGEVFKPAIGVVVFQSGYNQIAHNHIHDLYYTAISVGWTWGYKETVCHDNIVEFNHLHDIGKNLLSDMGAIYTLGPQKGTVLRNNLIHDVSAFTYGGWGIYPDEGSSDILIENNIVYRTKSAGFHQHYGKDNIVRNNIFAFGKEHQLMRTRAENHNSFVLTNNIVYFDSGDLLSGNWSGKNFKIDHNLYFDARAKTKEIQFAGISLADWRKLGSDVNSVIADPLFISPAHYDFRLRAASPALKMGFKQIDMSEVGVRESHRNSDR